MAGAVYELVRIYVTLETFQLLADPQAYTPKRHTLI